MKISQWIKKNKSPVARIIYVCIQPLAQYEPQSPKNLIEVVFLGDLNKGILVPPPKLFYFSFFTFPY